MAVVRIDGIEPHLRMLADYQRLVFENDPVVKFQQFSAYEPVDGIDTENMIELRNSRLSGFRLHQMSAFDDTFSPGVFKLQYFETDGAGTDIFTYDEGGLTFNTVVAFDPSQELFISPDYTPPPNDHQNFIFPSSTAEFGIKNSHNYVGDISSTRLNLLNYSGYGYRFNHITNDSSAPYGVMHFQLVDNMGSATEVFYIDSTKLTFNKPIDMNTQKIIGLGTPTLTADAATKGYVDGLVGVIPTSYNVSGSIQSFNFPSSQPITVFQLKNNFVFTGVGTAYSNFDMVNYQSYGFRFNHNTTDGNAPYGQLSLYALDSGGIVSTLARFSNTSLTMSVPINMSNNRISSAFVSIGTTTANGQLQFSNAAAARKIVLYEGANNDFQFMGLGTLSTDTLAYQVNATTVDHVWYAGISSSAKNELLRVKGNGDIIVPSTGAFYGRSPVGGMYMSSSANTSLTGTIAAKIDGTTTLLSSFSRNFSMPANNRLQYDGSQTITALVSVTGTYSVTTSSNILNIYIYKNGTIYSPTDFYYCPSNTGASWWPLSVSALVSMSTGDYLELWCKNSVNTTLKLERLTFIVNGV